MPRLARKVRLLRGLQVPRPREEEDLPAWHRAHQACGAKWLHPLPAQAESATSYPVTSASRGGSWPQSGDLPCHGKYVGVARASRLSPWSPKAEGKVSLTGLGGPNRQWVTTLMVL